MTETQWKNRVIGLCRDMGLLWHHSTQTKRDGGNRGFPDLVIRHPVSGNTLLVELKVHPNKPTPEQEQWADYVAYPEDYDELVMAFQHLGDRWLKP